MPEKSEKKDTRSELKALVAEAFDEWYEAKRGKGRRPPARDPKGFDPLGDLARAVFGGEEPEEEGQ